MANTGNNAGGSDSDGIVYSNIKMELDDIPKISLWEFIKQKLAAGVPKWGHKDIVHDITSGTSVKFRDLENHSLRVASALARRGFKKGDVLYFVTYELANLAVVHLAVWRLGGCLRGCFQAMPPAEYARQIKETHSKFLLVDADTAPLLKQTAALLSWPLEMFTIGNTTVPGLTSFADMMKDDGSACPDKVEVDIYEDYVIIANTSGSTGLPKGVIHTHRSAVSLMVVAEKVVPPTSFMHTMMTNGIGTCAYFLQALCSGLSIYYTGKFQKETYIEMLLKHKPEHIMMYPYVATWFARCETELARIRESGFLKSVTVSGWMLDPTSNDLLNQHLPKTSVRLIYGSTEAIATSITIIPESGEVVRLKRYVDSVGQCMFSNGNLMPLTEAKIVNPADGSVLKRDEEGEIYFRTPSMMKGYLVPGEPPKRDDIDKDGWFRTGDLGFFDKDDHLYIKERIVFTYKYCMQRISPNEIESLIIEHPSILAAGVVGLPNPKTDCEARAFVTLRPGCQATEDEIVKFVASRMPLHKQIHAGVRFLDVLPVNRGFKLDRLALKKLALEERAQAQSK